MQELSKQAQNLWNAVAEAIDRLHIMALQDELERLNREIAEPNFWQDSTHAQEVSKQQSKLEGRVKPWVGLETSVREIIELAATNDASLQADLEAQLKQAETTFESLKSQLKFAGLFDDNDAIVSIHAGAGGTDAQDWAQMLYRMYARWAEQQGMKLTVDDESSGEEAGLKSITFEVSGSFAYGRLKGEHGVHRLVRLSPFNADNLRQTSFAKIEVLPKIDQPEAVQLDEKDLKIDVFRSGGHGGQSVNTTDSAVRVTHLPTNIVVTIQNERSQLQNKDTALTILRSKLAQLQLEQHAADLRELKGPNEQAAWGNQIRSYVLHPYRETSDPDAVLDGALEPFIDAYLEYSLGS